VINVNKGITLIASRISGGKGILGGNGAGIMLLPEKDSAETYVYSDYALDKYPIKYEHASEPLIAKRGMDGQEGGNLKMLNIYGGTVISEFIGGGEGGDGGLGGTVTAIKKGTNGAGGEGGAGGNGGKGGIINIFDGKLLVDILSPGKGGAGGGGGGTGLIGVPVSGRGYSAGKGGNGGKGGDSMLINV
jgi:hypothetical protein